MIPDPIKESITWDDVQEKLSEPFSDEEIGSYESNKFTVQFVKAKTVKQRLDKVVGCGNWSTSYRTIDPTVPAVECTLTIFGVSKANVGYPNKQGSDQEDEPWKSAYSDALKRVSEDWGIGRHLIPNPAKKGQQQPSGGNGQRQSNYQSQNNGQQQPSGGNGEYQIKNPGSPMSDAQRKMLTDLFKQLGYGIPGDFEQYTKGRASEVIGKCKAEVDKRKSGAPQQPQQQPQQTNTGPLMPDDEAEFEAALANFNKGAAPKEATPAAPQKSQAPQVKPVTPQLKDGIERLIGVLGQEVISQHLGREAFVPETYAEGMDMLRALAQIRPAVPVATN